MNIGWAIGKKNPDVQLAITRKIDCSYFILETELLLLAYIVFLTCFHEGI